MARIKTRYGYSQQVSDPDDPWITRKLIAELRSEQFDDQTTSTRWQAVVRGDKAALLEHPWKPLSGLPPYVRDFYRVGT